MKLSDQAMGSLMMVLQKCLMEQSDIVPMLKELDFNDNIIEDLKLTESKSANIAH